MKRNKGAILAIGAAVFLMAGCFREDRPPDGARPDRLEERAVSQEKTELTKAPIRIGVMYALSGNNAAIGTNILRGIDFAVEDINTAGGIDGRPIEIVRGDNPG